MNFRKRVAFLAALPILVAAALGGTTDRSAAETAREGAATKAGRLVAFRSCGDLLGYAKSQAARFVGPYGLGGQVALKGAPATAREAAPQQGVDFSGTNVQEEGVDEPDIVKTNGNTLFAIANGKLNAVDVSNPKPRLLDTLKLDPALSHELLLHGDRLLLLSRGGFWMEPLPAIAARMMPYAPAQSVLAEIDVSNPKALRVVRTLSLDGAYIAARLVGSSARIVATSQVPSALPFAQPKNGTKEELAAAGKRNRAVVASSRVGSWLPSYTIKRTGVKAARKHALVQCRNVRRPVGFSGLGMLTVLTVDLAKGLEPVDSVAVMTDARIVYASPESLYVATERWAERPSPERPTQVKASVSTAIHKFDISSPSRTQYRGSGEVSGYLLSQWSLSEYQGVLRVVSTESPAWWGAGGETESFLTTLRDRGGALVQAGRIGELGKGERVYAVRFAGDVGYVVTFKQIDPLYTLDLAVPEKPRVVGELKIPGYSAYLHPIGEDLLLGIGQDVDEQGRPLGTQLSLFDVSDLRKPTRLHRQALGPGWSEAESDHHAFLFWPPTGLVVIPFEQRAVGYRVSRARGIDAVGKIDHEAGKLTYAPGIRRSLVVRNAVLTVSEAGVKASNLATLAEVGWAAFPAPEQPVPKPVP
ncbi:MAG: hypothetical protein QOF45_182 [Gaiellaceae bacterium]|jgi:uncharacterized secreted protein with C-terminal beta-propeller domain|nr:hypothetical protein [Gaiellaceae bacterium]